MKAAIFDMDGTLVDTELIWQLAWRELNKELDLGATDESLKKIIGLPRHDFYKVKHEIFKKDVDTDELRPQRVKFYNNYVKENGLNLKPGVKKLLDYLKSNNYLLAVCTSTYLDQAKEVLNKTDILNYFNVIVSGDMVIHGKPDPEIYQTAMDKLNVSPEMCIAFEDSNYGIISATSANIKTYFIKDIIDLKKEYEILIYKRLNTIDEVLDDLTNVQQ